MANALVKWYHLESSKYKTLDPKDPNALYFITDTQELYRGSVSFTQAMELYPTGVKPVAPAQGRIYVDDATLAGSVWTGSAWKEVIAPVSQTIDPDSPTTGPVSGAAVKGYVDTKMADVQSGLVSSIGYDPTTYSVTFTKGETTEKVALTKLLTGVTYDGSTGNLKFTDSAGTVVSDINLPLDNFVKNGHYDSENNALVLEMQNGTEVSIPAGDLVALYTATDTNSVDITIETVDGVNTIKADLKISAEEGNSLVIKDDGLYVNAPDLSSRLEKLGEGNADEVVTSNADGTIKRSGVKVGGASLAETPDTATLATEAAVQAIKNAIELTASTTYVAKTDISTAIPAAADAVDTKVASEKAVATAIETAITDAGTKYVSKDNVVLAEADINTAAPREDFVISEKAFVEALSWHTIA